MTGHWELRAMCLHAETPLDCPGFDERVFEPRKVKAVRANMEIWMTEHYRKTGHHRFEVTDTKIEEVSVATVVDPNQLLLSDDPSYSTFTLGSDHRHFCLVCSDGNSPGPGCINCRQTGMDQTPCLNCPSETS